MLGIDFRVACVHGNTAQMQRGNDLARFRWSNKAGAARSRALQAAEDEAEEQQREGRQRRRRGAAPAAELHGRRSHARLLEILKQRRSRQAAVPGGPGDAVGRASSTLAPMAARRKTMEEVHGSRAPGGQS